MMKQCEQKIFQLLQSVDVNFLCVEVWLLLHKTGLEKAVDEKFVASFDFDLEQFEA
jgi:hypothetical protein